MTITYVQAFNPLWYVVDIDGTAAGGAQLFTYDSLTRLPKAVYQDSAGINAWPNPLIFRANGTAGPIYWKQDSANPNNNYYYEIYNAQGLLLDDENNFPVGNTGGGGGGGNVTNYISIKNYITNNQFIDNIGDQTGPLPTNLVLAPSNHKGFTPALIHPVVGTYGVLGPDIRFVKNNTAATDSLSFVEFPLASAPLTGDVTPVWYMRYISNMAAGETYKSFQFPITQKVKNLSNTQMTFGVWAAVTSTPVQLHIYTRQYYGSGTGATPESSSTRVELSGSPITLSTTWTWFPITFTVPDVSGNTLGTPGLQTDDDALYIQIDMPLGTACDVLFTKPALFLGAVDPDAEFDSYDMIDSIDQTPRTSTVQSNYMNAAFGGWIPMDDGTIGNVGSGASTRANKDTFQLYKTLWDQVINTWAPVSGGRGATAIADFLAGKTLTLPRALGRALAQSGAGSGLTVRALGEYDGQEKNILLATNLPDPLLNGLGIAQATNTGAFTVILNNDNTGSGVLHNPGGNQPFTNIPPTSFTDFYIKL